ncbi:hypothetical protein [Streptomyces sp. NPDC001661]
MSVAAPAARPGHRVPGLVRALVVLLALLIAPLAAAPAGASAPPPVAASSCEPGEGARDASEQALRLPTGHPVRLLTAPPRCIPPRLLPTARPDTTTHPAPPSRRALRTVVLRC